MESGGVEDHQAFDPFRIACRPAETDHATPIVNHEVDVVEPEVIHEAREITDAAAQGVFVGIVARLVREPTAHVVRNDDAVFIPQISNQVAVVKRPGRVAVHRHDGVAFPLIQIVKPKIIDLQPVPVEWIEMLRCLFHLLFSDSRTRIATTAARPWCS